MKNTDTGEFELVLGNKQLLSLFAIVVILFGVFFTLGYILGRNSTPSPRMAESQGFPAPSPAESRPQASEAPAPAPAAAAEEPGAGAEPQPGTQAAREPENPAATPAADKTAPPEAAGQTPVSEPGSGTYLQVVAVKRQVAEVVLKTLRDKGFPVILGPGPNDLLRVLVGPYTESGALGKAKADLENAGFHPIVRRGQG